MTQSGQSSKPRMWFGDEPFSCEAGDRWTDDDDVVRVSGGIGWATITRPPSDEHLELLELDRVLDAEKVPRWNHPSNLPRVARIRWLGDQRRKAEQLLAGPVQSRYKVVGGKIIDGQFTVDEMIEDIEHNGY